MEQAGYHYATPRDANNDSRWSGPTASPLEIATAIADVRCKRTTGLLDIWVAVTRAYEQRYVDRHAAALAELTTAMEALERRAPRGHQPGVSVRRLDRRLPSSF